MASENVRTSGFHQHLDQQEVYNPWYRAPTNEHPFKLVRRFNLNIADAPAFKSLAIFPWDNESLGTLWGSGLDMPENRAQWQDTISKYWDAVAVGSDYQLYVFFTQKRRAPLSVKLPQDQQVLIDADKMCIGWGINHNAPFEPLIMFTRGSLLYIYNPERKGISGYHRGHGGAITSVAVHPKYPNLFATTSRDYTTRIYEMTLPAELPRFDPETGKKKEVPNPHWPPNRKPSLAGAAHGLRLDFHEKEGIGEGRCICVLMGGRSGGHQAAVLGAAFHPDFKIIATCGMDRSVKIWPVRPQHVDQIKREDKPIFSSSMVHKARVLSINWLQSDMLLTHSAPAVMRIDPHNANNKRSYIEAGELTMWRWLSLNRFFPPAHEGRPITAMRGISSDYQESASFKLISTHKFPLNPEAMHVLAHRLSLFQSPTHDPLVLLVFPCAPSFLMLNASHMRPREPPPFPPEAEKLLSPTAEPPSAADAEQSAELAQAAAQHLGLGGQAEDGEDEASAEEAYRRGYGKDKGKGKEKETEASAESEAEDPDAVPEVISGKVDNRAEVPVPEITGWEVSLDEGDEGRLMDVAMGMGGRMMIGVGTHGNVWVWRCED